MSITTAHKSHSVSKHVARETMEYRLIFAVCFPVLFVTTLAEKLMREPSANSSPAKSLFAEAKDATHRCTSLAFTG